MNAHFERFTLSMTLTEAKSASHPGPCDADVEYLLTLPKIRRQLQKIPPNLIRAELREYGAWAPEELDDHEENLARTVWIAAGNITEDHRQRTR